MRNHFVQICLAMIVVLLAVIAYRQAPHIAYGAAPKEYKVVYVDASNSGYATAAVKFEAMMNQQAKDGWELVTAPAEASEGYFTFKK